MKAHQLVNQSSGDTEWYTPQFIIEAARKVLGQIDLDPASSALSNKRVKAMRYFTVDDDGLEQDWQGSVWMNHPFSREHNAQWINKLVQEYTDGHVPEAICITFAATSEKWFQPLLRYPQCFLHPRTNYELPDGTINRGVTKGSVVTYLGIDTYAFVDAFKSFGVVKIRA